MRHLHLLIAVLLLVVEPTLIHSWALNFRFRPEAAAARISRRRTLVSSSCRKGDLPKERTTTLLAAPTGPPSENIETGGYSFVEGGDYDSLEEEIEAMGGDPSFLEDYEDGNLQVSGGDDWDGTVDEDAYFD